MASAAILMVDSPITAGGYLRLRRLAAELTPHAVAVACASAPVSVSAVLAAIEDAEADRVPFEAADLRRLQAVIPFVPGVYLALAMGLDGGDICRGCGCTWTCACIEGGGGCAWTDDTKSFCTTCARKSL
jgi:hypothetical protein